MEENKLQTVKYPLGRKSLAVDLDTYNMLQEICDSESRSKIDQLKVLIKMAHKQLVVAETVSNL